MMWNLSATKNVNVKWNLNCSFVYHERKKNTCLSWRREENYQDRNTQKFHIPQGIAFLIRENASVSVNIFHSTEFWHRHTSGPRYFSCFVPSQHTPRTVVRAAFRSARSHRRFYWDSRERCREKKFVRKFIGYSELNSTR